MSWLEQKYINLMSTRFRNFKRKSNQLWNFSCPICGDSDNNKHKARGYIYHKKSSYVFYCHNCGASIPLAKFIKQIDITLYNEYMKELLLDKKVKEEDPIVTMKPPVFISNNEPLRILKKVSQLSPEHFAKKYVVSRQIPTPYHAKLFFCPKFKTWVNSIISNKFSDLTYDEPRLIIPFLDSENILYGFQGRSLNPRDEIRYITIMVDESRPRLYGMDSLKLNERVYVFEGPIDSMFIPNSVASAGGNIIRELQRLTIDKNNYTIVYDNERRNPDTVKKIQQAIDAGYNVCIWPETIEEKDINDMVLKKVANRSSVNTEQIDAISYDIKKIIDQNTHNGLQAILKLNSWKR